LVKQRLNYFKVNIDEIYIMKKEKVIFGVDIGGTNTAIGLFDLNNNFLSEKSFETKSSDGADIYIERLANSLNEILNEYSGTHILTGIGLAAPNADYRTGCIENSVNLKWKKVNLVKMLKKYFDIALTLINDANAAALGEQAGGSARGMKNFIVLTLGTGLGSGIVVDGNLINGENGLAGELGHVIVKPDGRKCNCGRNGCLETYISANGIRRTVFDLISYYDEETKLRDISFNDLTSLFIAELARKGDPVAKKVFKYTGEILGKALADIASCFDPEAIIFTGGLSESGDLLINPTKFFFEKSLLSIYKNKVKILKSSLQNSRAAVLGAGHFVLKEAEKNKTFR
jgi:glucokinase